jgi:hypothetical protein
MDTRTAARRWARTWARAWPDKEACFADELAPTETWFAEPQVDGNSVAVEYWAVLRRGGLVREARDYSHLRDGRELPPVCVFDAAE